MPEGELGAALAVLRVVRGWSQQDLALASGVPASSISNYERAKTLPALRTLSRLVGAMGFPLAALDEAKTFIYSVRVQSALKAGGAIPPGPRGVPASSASPAASEERSFADLVPEDDPASALRTGSPPVLENPASLQWELEQVSAEAGRVVSRVARVILHLLYRSGHLQRPEQDHQLEGESEGEEP